MQSALLKPIPQWVQRALVAVLATLYAVALASALWEQYGQTWHKVPGHIEQVREVHGGSFGPALSELKCLGAVYSYVTVSGESYRASDYSRGTECLPESVGMSLVGRGRGTVPVDVYYLESSPDVAVLQFGFGTARAIMYALLGVALLVLTAAVLRKGNLNRVGG